MKLFAILSLSILVKTYGLGLETTNEFDTKAKYNAWDKIAESVIHSGIRKGLNMGRIEYEFNKKLWSPIELNSNEDAELLKERSTPGKESDTSGEDSDSSTKKPQPDSSTSGTPVDINPPNIMKWDNGPDTSARSSFRTTFGKYNDLSLSTVHESAIGHQEREMKNIVYYTPTSGDDYYKIKIDIP